mgnify:CR=1 FL=1
MKKYDIEPYNENQSKYDFQKEEAYLRAKKKLDKLVGFYWHLAVYVIINLFLIVIVGTQSGEGFWHFSTFATAFFCIVFAIVVPEVELSIFSPGKRQSVALMGVIVDFLKKLNTQIFAYYGNALLIAEDSTAYPKVTHPVDMGGLGFNYKWNMGWMNDTLDYFERDPVYRKYHHHDITFGLTYAFSENYVLPLSHDEVVHGKQSIAYKMPGDDWQRFANLRAYYGFMYAHPGKKLLFMGSELAQEREWDHDRSLDWHLLDQPRHKGIQTLVRDLNRVYSETLALHELDFSAAGFEWIDWQDADNSVFCWLRRATDGTVVICVSNFTPLVRRGYRLGVPQAGDYVELINTDDEKYGGSGVRSSGEIVAQGVEAHGRPYSLTIDLPPLATMMLIMKDAVSE